MFRYLFAIILSYLLIDIFIPLLINISLKLDFTDKPTNRKKHKKSTPLIGGIGMYISFSIVYFVFSYKYKIAKANYIFLGATTILLIGLVDDFYKSKKKEFPIAPRLIVQILVASMMFFQGIIFRGFTNPISEKFILFPIVLQYLCTVTWIFGVITVINWSDGMDGVAGSIVAISLISLLIISMLKNQNESNFIILILLGSVIGFLKYNKHPAKIFMGDSGANFLGFILSIIALEGSFKQTTLISIIVPFIILGVPIFDNMFVVITRALRGKKIYAADRLQLHYRLQSKGLNKKQIVLYISLLSILLSIISIILSILKI